MKSLIIILCICISTGFAQNLEKIKNSEVLFIYYDGGEYESKRILQTYKDKKDDIKYYYKFKKGNNCNIVHDRIEIAFNHYYDFDEMFKNNPVPFFKLNKSFLKMNKDIILTTNFLHKIGCKQSWSLLYNAKTIFLIDKDDIDDNIVTVKKVRLANIAEE